MRRKGRGGVLLPVNKGHESSKLYKKSEPKSKLKIVILLTLLLVLLVIYYYTQDDVLPKPSQIQKKEEASITVKEYVDPDEPFKIDTRFLSAITKSEAPMKPRVQFGGDPRFHGVWGTTTHLSKPWIEDGFDVVRDDMYDVLFSRYTKKKATKNTEREVHLMGLGTRIFSHCHTLLGIAGNKCSFSLYLDAVRDELGENIMSKALIKSYVYPHQKSEVLQLMNDSPSWSKGRLIFKSCLGKRGVGLQVVSRLEDLPTSGFSNSNKEDMNGEESWVTRTVFGRRIKADWMVQPYLYRPLLLSNHRKFHMRLYVVVGSWHPLQIFLFRDGLTLFASQRYIVFFFSLFYG